MKLTLLTLVIVCFGSAYGQVEHNFEMEPENTNCENLDSLDLDEHAFAREIMGRTYRLKEEIRISDYSSPNGFGYFSCDGNTGYLLVYQSADEYHVYKNVETSQWTRLEEARDPRELFRNLKQNLTRWE